MMLDIAIKPRMMSETETEKWTEHLWQIFICHMMVDMAIKSRMMSETETEKWTE